MKNILIVIYILLMCSPIHASTREERKQKKATSVTYIYDAYGNFVGKEYVYKKKKLTKEQKANRRRNVQKLKDNPVRIMPKKWRSKK